MGNGTALILGTDLLIPKLSDDHIEECADKPELTCISEEGIADMDLPDNLLDDLDYAGECISSCNKVEKYLVLSEFENNLNAELPIILEKKGRFSLPLMNNLINNSQDANDIEVEIINSTKWKPPDFLKSRVITVIGEASV